VLVLGMHRSGTSLVTRLVSLLGVALCSTDDLLAGLPANPRGHWESKSLLRFDDRLLRELDSSWFCPPSIDRGELAQRLAPYRERGLAALREAHPRRPFVWKDPRACLLLPFWTNVLERRGVYVVVARHPTEVAESLERRNGFTPAYSMALWERYMRLTLLNGAGLPTVVCTYDEVLTEPVAWCERLAAFLRELGVELPPVPQAPVSAFVAGDLRRGRRSWQDLEPAELFTPERIALVEAATRTGTHLVYEPPSLPAEAPATERILSELRRDLAAEGSLSLSAVPAHLARPRSRRGEDRPSSASLILTWDPPAAAALDRVLPAGSEVIAPRDAGGVKPQGGSEGLARTLEEARGRTVLVSSAALPAEGDWYERLAETLASSPSAAGVGAALHVEGDPARRHRRAAFAGSDLTLTLERVRAERKPAPTPLLCGGLCAFDKRLLSAAGGLDPEFDTVFAAFAELSLRLWRMRFRVYELSHVEVEVGRGQIEPPAGLYDRLRIAALHLEPGPLEAFLERVAGHPGYDEAAARLRASDVESRRALADAVCIVPASQFFEELGARGPRARLRRARGAAARTARRWQLLRAANGPRENLQLVAQRLAAAASGRRRRGRS
jgi:hypothetical protein